MFAGLVVVGSCRDLAASCQQHHSIAGALQQARTWCLSAIPGKSCTQACSPFMGFMDPAAHSSRHWFCGLLTNSGPPDAQAVTACRNLRS